LVCGMNLKVWGWGLGIRVKNNEFKSFEFWDL